MVDHHNVFRFVRRVDHWVLTLNLLLLLCVALIPFPTAVLAEHIEQPDESAATVFYAGVFVVTALFSTCSGAIPALGALAAGA